MIQLTRREAGFYYYFGKPCHYVLKKEGNRWALYESVRGAIKGVAITFSRTLSNLKGFLAEYIDHNEETTTPICPECPDSEVDSPVEIDSPDYSEGVDFKTDTHLDIDSEHVKENEQPEYRDTFDNDNIHDYDCLYSNSTGTLDFSSIVHEVKRDIAENTFLDKFIYYLELLKVDRQKFDDYLIYKPGDIYDDDFDFSEIIYEVKEAKVFDRLFALYCPDTAFVIPSNPHLKEYVDRLDKDGRYFTKKQLTLFGEDK